jgi:hypothetical protein
MEKKRITNAEFGLTMKYQVIYADPPWAYLWGTGKKGSNFAPEKHYETMPIEEICALNRQGIKRVR